MKALQYIFREYVAAFCFKNTPEGLQMIGQMEKFIFSFLCNLYVLFESFWSQNVGKPSTKFELITQHAAEEKLADFG